MWTAPPQMLPSDLCRICSPQALIPDMPYYFTATPLPTQLTEAFPSMTPHLRYMGDIKAPPPPPTVLLEAPALGRGVEGHTLSRPDTLRTQSAARASALIIHISGSDSKQPQVQQSERAGAPSAAPGSGPAGGAEAVVSA